MKLKFRFGGLKKLQIEIDSKTMTILKKAVRCYENNVGNRPSISQLIRELAQDYVDDCAAWDERIE